ncbi:hypothetical protein PTKIN_Ptkin14bG0184700 [Pterospermum kingtungense]
MAMNFGVNSPRVLVSQPTRSPNIGGSINAKENSNKEQGGCCWSFKTVAATEGITQIKSGNLVSLSEQQLLDCTGDGYNCDGGYKVQAFQYIIQNPGLTTRASYPYNEAQGTFSIEASQDFHHYGSGIFTGNCGTNHNHAVAIVGFGTDEELGLDYWLVKNSWGEDWGENGYIRMQRNAAVPQGLCGLAMNPVYPIA